MEEYDKEIKVLLDDWHVAYKRGNDFDLWGQPVEAIDCYTRLSANMRYEAHPEGTLFTDEQKKVLKKLAACLELRAKTLRTPGKLESMSLNDMKKVEETLKNLLVTKAKDFPVDVSSRDVHLQSQISTVSLEASSDISSQTSSRISNEGHLGEDEGCPDSRFLGSLLPPPESGPEYTIVTIRIEKIGLKDAAQYIDSAITVSVKDSQGINVTQKQDTPVVHTKDDSYVYFGVDVHLQKPLEHLADDFAIFFEFKHYKPKKKLVSTRCWTIMERDEIKEGPVALELYKKPTDYKRKKLHLLTSKPLFLHLKVIFNG